jgi:S1-C subfamily serine protease
VRTPASRNAGATFALLILCASTSTRADGSRDRDLALVQKAEERRVELIDRVTPSVVCIYDKRERGGGSGVIIEPDGYGLTNYHVVAGMLKTRTGLAGLPDGRLYDLEVLGIDPTGDIAMFRLTGRDRFPYVPLGDSDALEVGDPVYVLGNPFSLSDDYTPTVTIGMVTGLHRYQWGLGNNLVYSDCIQTDAAINPGNSGGPLINARGEVVGINGRISVNTRGRYNVGLGYAISANQIRRFVPALRAGLLAKHGTLNATVDYVEGTGTVFSDTLPGLCADRAGIAVGDRLVSFDRRTINSRNEFASVLGTYPANWPVRLAVEHNGVTRDLDLRLDPLEPNLRRPFEVAIEVNQREIRRVLRRFQRTVYGDRRPNPPTVWKWAVRRAYADPGAADKTKPPQRFEVTLTGDEPAVMRRVFDDGAHGNTIEFNTHTAVRRTSADGATFDLTTDEALILAALYTMHTELTAPIEDLDLARFMHVGSDRLLRGDGTRSLEVLATRVAEDGQARFGFDTETGRLVQAQLVGDRSGVSVSLRFTDHRDVGGLIWPATIEVDGPGYAYRDALSDWELSQ